MKGLLTLIMICSLALISCHKTILSGKSLPEKLTGKWRYAQSYYSSGGPLIYVSTENLRQWIDFKEDGSFTSNMPKFEKVTGYEMQDSSKVKFLTPSQQPAFRLFFIFIDSSNHSLSLSPADLICIEGCGDNFKR